MYSIKINKSIYMVVIITAVLTMVAAASVIQAGGTLNLNKIWSKSGDYLGVATNNIGTRVFGIYVGSSSTYAVVYDDNGNTLGGPWSVSDYDGGYHNFIAKTYDGNSFYYISKNILYRFYYDQSTGQWTSLSTTINGDLYTVYSTQKDGHYVITYEKDADGKYYVYVYAGDNLKSLASQIETSDVTDIAVTYDSTDTYIAVAHNNNYLSVYYFDVTTESIKSITTDQTAPVKVALTEKGYFLVSLESTGKLLLLERSGSGGTASYSIKATVPLAGTDSISNIYGLAVQEYDDHGTPDKIKIAVTFEDDNTDQYYLGIYEFDTSNEQLSVDRLVVLNDEPLEDLVDMSYYGNYVALSTVAQTYVYDISNDDIKGTQSEYDYMDLSENAKTLVTSTSNNNDLTYWTTGVIEDDPVPVPEFSWLMSGVVVIFASVLLFYWRRI